MARINLPEDKDVAIKVVETQSAKDQKNIEMGMLGMLLGDVRHKPGNIAFITILFSFLIIVLMLFANPTADIPKREVFTLFASLITGALGYLFGRGSDRDS